MREKKAVDPDYLKRCARCFLKGLCEQCPGKSWLEHGTLDTPVEYFCEIAHVLARHLGLLREREMGWEVRDWRERIRTLNQGGVIMFQCVSRSNLSADFKPFSNSNLCGQEDGGHYGSQSFS